MKVCPLTWGQRPFGDLVTPTGPRNDPYLFVWLEAEGGLICSEMCRCGKSTNLGQMCRWARTMFYVPHIIQIATPKMETCFQNGSSMIFNMFTSYFQVSNFSMFLDVEGAKPWANWDTHPSTPQVWQRIKIFPRVWTKWDPERWNVAGFFGCWVWYGRAWNILKHLSHSAPSLEWCFHVVPGEIHIEEFQRRPTWMCVPATVVGNNYMT